MNPTPDLDAIVERPGLNPRTKPIRTALALADSMCRSGEKPSGTYNQRMRAAWKRLNELESEPQRLAALEGAQEWIAFAVEFVAASLGEDNQTVKAGRRTLAALTPRPAGVDARELANAMRRVDMNDGRDPMPPDGYYYGLALDIAREYTALTGSEEPARE